MLHAVSYKRSPKRKKLLDDIILFGHNNGLDLLFRDGYSIKHKYEYILVAVISPILKTRQLAKKKFGNNYYEIYVHCSIKTLEKRDTKGLYDEAKKKIIKNLIGYNSSIKYQKSRYSKIDINTDKFNLKKCIQIIKNKINLKST